MSRSPGCVSVPPLPSAQQALRTAVRAMRAKRTRPHRATLQRQPAGRRMNSIPTGHARPSRVTPSSLRRPPLRPRSPAADWLGFRVCTPERQPLRPHRTLSPGQPPSTPASWLKSLPAFSPPPALPSRAAEAETRRPGGGPSERRAAPSSLPRPLPQLLPQWRRPGRKGEPAA